MIYLLIALGVGAGAWLIGYVATFLWMERQFGHDPEVTNLDKALNAMLWPMHLFVWKSWERR